MSLDWQQVDTVLLDMDGTLLDLEFDNVLWNQLVPQTYADTNGLSLDEAWAELDIHFTRAAHTLPFYCLDHWARVTRLDIIGLHHQLSHLIRYRPRADRFLAQLQAHADKRVLLVTNAHRDSLSIKDAVTGLTRHLDRSISAHDYAAPKEDPAFWAQLSAEEQIDPARTLLIDDTARVLEAAANFGIGHLYTIAQPDSGRPPRTDLAHPSLHCFSELLP